MTSKIGGPGAPPGPVVPSELGAERDAPTKPVVPAKPDQLSLGPDRVKALLPQSPHAVHRGSESKTGGTSVEFERKAAPALYQSTHFESPTAFMSKEDIEIAKRLCHRMSAEAWPQLYAAFHAALQSARAEGAGDSTEMPELAEDWYTGPWMYARADVESVVSDSSSPDFPAARRMGFRNLALLGSLEAPALELVANTTRALDLRVTTAIELSGTSGQLHDPVWLSGVLHDLSTHLRLGVLGFRTHGIDLMEPRELGAPGEGLAAHAFQALLKLYLRTLRPPAIVVPELCDPASSGPLQAGGALELDGLNAPAEGDLIHWRSGMLALRAALEGQTRAPLDDALEDIPTLLHGARRLCSLEHHDSEVALLDLVAWSPERLCLALALLYFMPATPAVYAPSARALPAGRAVLKLLNRLRAGHAGLASGDLWAVAPTGSEGVLWCRGRPTDPSGALILAANLSSRTLDLRVPESRLKSAGLAGPGRIRPLGRARKIVGLDGAGFRVELPPYGFVFCMLDD